MAVVRLMESFIDSQEMLYNLCHYIVGEPGSLKRHFSRTFWKNRQKVSLSYQSRFRPRKLFRN